MTLNANARPIPSSPRPRDLAARAGALHSRPLWPVVAAAFVGTTLASLLYLHLASRIEMSGRDIVALEQRRSELLEARAAALRSLADLTSPARLDSRAKALGFRRHGDDDLVAVPSAVLTRRDSDAFGFRSVLAASADSRPSADGNGTDAGTALGPGSVFGLTVAPADMPAVDAWVALAGRGPTTASASGLASGSEARRLP